MSVQSLSGNQPFPPMKETNQQKVKKGCIIHFPALRSKLLGVKTVPTISLSEKEWKMLKKASSSELTSKGGVYLTNILPGTFLSILQFIITKNFTTPPDNLSNIWEAADQLKLGVVKNQCLEWVKGELSNIQGDNFEDAIHETTAFLPWMVLLLSHGHAAFVESYITKMLNVAIKKNLDCFSMVVDLFKDLPVHRLQKIEWPKNPTLFFKKFVEFKHLKNLTIDFPIDLTDFPMIKSFSHLLELHIVDGQNLTPVELQSLKEWFSLEKLCLENLSERVQTEKGIRALNQLPLKTFKWIEWSPNNSKSPFKETIISLDDGHLSIFHGSLLEELHLYGWKHLSGTAFFDFIKIPHLKKIILDNCLIPETGLAVLSLVDQLESVHLKNISFSAHGLQAIGHMKSLKHLKIARNDQMIDEDLAFLEPLAHTLESLALCHCEKLEMSQKAFENLLKFQKLSTLDLRGTSIDESVLIEFLLTLNITNLYVLPNQISASNLGLIHDLKVLIHIQKEKN